MNSNATIRIAYMRMYGLISQQYYWYYQEIDADRSDTDEPLWGSMTAFTNYMVKFLNKRGLKTVLVRAPEMFKVGTSHINGTYDGLIGLLQSDQADFSSFPIALGLPFDPIEYTDYFAETKSVFLESSPLKKDNGESIDFLVQLIQIFSRDIWMLFLNVISIVVLLLYFIQILKRIYLKGTLSINSVTMKMMSILWQLIRIPINQPDIQFKKHKARFIILCFMIMIIFSNIMALNLIGTKMVVHTDNIIKSFEELLTKPDYDVRWLRNSYILPKFEASNDPNSIYVKIYNLFSTKSESVIDLTSDISTVPAMLRKAFVKPETVYIDEEFSMGMTSLHIYKLLHETVQLRKTIIEPGLTTRFAYGYNKRIDPLLKQWLHQANKRAFEAGFSSEMPELALRFDPSTANVIHCLEKGPETENDLRPIMMNDIIVLILISCIVVAIAFACLAFELINWHFRQNPIRKLVRKIKIHARVLKIRVEDRMLFGYSTRYHRRIIRVYPMRGEEKW